MKLVKFCWHKINGSVVRITLWFSEMIGTSCRTFQRFLAHGWRTACLEDSGTEEFNHLGGCPLKGEKEKMESCSSPKRAWDSESTLRKSYMQGEKKPVSKTGGLAGLEGCSEWILHTAAARCPHIRKWPGRLWLRTKAWRLVRCGEGNEIWKELVYFDLIKWPYSETRAETE